MCAAIFFKCLKKIAKCKFDTNVKAGVFNLWLKICKQLGC